MVSQELLDFSLFGVIVMGLVPFLTGIVLVKFQKLWGSNFVSGLIAMGVVIIVNKITEVVVSLVFPSEEGKTYFFVYRDMPSGVVLMILSGIVTAVVVCICVCMCSEQKFDIKETVSCGMGFGTGYLMYASFILLVVRENLVQIKKGGFDYKGFDAVTQGYLDENVVDLSKLAYLNITYNDMLSHVIFSFGYAMLCFACGILIMHSIYTKKLKASVTFSAFALAVTGIIYCAVPDILTGSVISALTGFLVLLFSIVSKFKNKSAD